MSYSNKTAATKVGRRTLYPTILCSDSAPFEVVVGGWTVSVEASFTYGSLNIDAHHTLTNNNIIARLM